MRSSHFAAQGPVKGLAIFFLWIFLASFVGGGGTRTHRKTLISVNMQTTRREKRGGRGN